eukprot:scaffold1808_cov360-Prasinococcus_capsulatus_cf.AAC.21
MEECARVTRAASVCGAVLPERAHHLHRDDGVHHGALDQLGPARIGSRLRLVMRRRLTTPVNGAAVASSRLGGLLTQEADERVSSALVDAHVAVAVRRGEVERHARAGGACVVRGSR